MCTQCICLSCKMLIVISSDHKMEGDETSKFSSETDCDDNSSPRHSVWPAPGVLCGEPDVVPERHDRLSRGGLRCRSHLSREHSGGGTDREVGVVALHQSCQVAFLSFLKQRTGGSAPKCLPPSHSSKNSRPHLFHRGTDFHQPRSGMSPTLKLVCK